MQVWHVADTPENDKFQYTYFAHKINSFDTAPRKLLASDSRLRPDRLALEMGDLSKSGAEKSRSRSPSFTSLLFHCTWKICQSILEAIEILNWAITLDDPGGLLRLFIVLEQTWVRWIKIETICIISHHLSATFLLYSFFWAFGFHQRDAVRLFPRVFMLCWFRSRLEERQRAEKRIREGKGHNFSPRWFDITEEVTSTPWGDLEIYQYNGKYTQHRAVIDNSTNTDDVDVKSIQFSPWQYESESTDWSSCNFITLFTDTRIEYAVCWLVYIVSTVLNST